jgi:hypothetical protein
MDIYTVEGFDDEWDEFVGTSAGGTIFHTLRFLSYHDPARFDFFNLAIRDGGRLVCVIPGAVCEGDSGKVYVSPAGASFGGFVFADDCDLAMMRDAVTAFGDHLRQAGFDRAEVTLPPVCYSRNEHQGIHFVLSSLGYVLTLREATAVVPVGEFGRKKPHPALSRALRKAEREGVRVREGGDPDEFYAVLTANLSAKDVEPTHTLDEIRKLFGLFPDNLILLEAVVEGRVVGGTLLMLCNDRTALSFYICDDLEERNKRVSETVIHGSLVRLKEMGYTYLDLGTVSRRGRPDWGLVRFKAKFGTRTYVREQYSLALGGGSA